MKNPIISDKTNLNPFKRGIEHGISLFTAVKNRKDTLTEALKTWVSHDEIDEIIIVDWNSDESLIPIIQKYQNGKIFLAVVKDQEKWILSHACNLAARLTTRSMLLKMDADVKIHKGFFDKHKLNPGIFYTGNWALGRDQNETHLNGVAFFYRDDFFKVNGYNEFIKSYGWDDSDLYLRLEQNNLKRIDFDLDSLHHIEHGNRTLFQDKPGYFRNISETERENLNIIINRHFGYNSKPWSCSNSMLDFSVTATDSYTIASIQSGDDKNIIHPGVIQQNELTAVMERLQSLDQEFSKMLMDQLNREELIEFYNLFFIPAANSSDQRLFSLIQKIKQAYNILIKQSEAEIQQFNEDKVNREQALERLTRDFRDKEQLLLQRDNIINERDRQIGVRDQVILGKDQLLSSRDAVIQLRDNELSAKEKTVQEKNQVIIDLDKFIIKQTETIGNYETSASEQQQVIQHASDAIFKLGRELQEKSANIDEMNSHIQGRDVALAQMNLELQNLDETMATLRMQLKAEQQTLKDIHNSHSWKTGHFVFSMIGKIMPWLTRNGS
ncbi:MAG: galactosyltransferase-related protein [Bacteroidota bacterium]